jgi:hypothetical protein
LTGSSELVLGEVSPSYEFITTGSAFEALHTVLDSSRITNIGSADDEQYREDLVSRMYAGLQAAETRFYDAVGPGGDPLPATEPGGSSFTVIAAAYADSGAATDAFGAFVDPYETWDFAEGMETWTHGDQSAAFAYSAMDRTHVRCHVLSSTQPCDQGLRVWRVDNLVVTVVAQGQGAVSMDELVDTLDAAIR